MFPIVLVSVCVHERDILKGKEIYHTFKSIIDFSLSVTLHISSLLSFSLSDYVKVIDSLISLSNCSRLQ